MANYFTLKDLLPLSIIAVTGFALFQPNSQLFQWQRKIQERPQEIQLGALVVSIPSSWDASERYITDHAGEQAEYRLIKQANEAVVESVITNISKATQIQSTDQKENGVIIYTESRTYGIFRQGEGLLVISAPKKFSPYLWEQI